MTTTTMARLAAGFWGVAALSMGLVGCGGGDSTGSPPGETAKAVTAANTVFYVDSVNGNDTTNSGADATHAFKTLAKVVAQPSISAIYLACGQTWREQATIVAGRLLPNAIITTFGTNCGSQKATISGADNYSGSAWTLNSSTGIWSRPITTSQRITQLFVNGSRYRLARYPNFNPNNNYATDFVTATGTNGSTTVTLSAADFANSHVSPGALILIRTLSYKTELSQVASVNAATSTITLCTVASSAPDSACGQWTPAYGDDGKAHAIQSPIPANAAVVVMGQTAQFDAEGEFVHDFHGSGVAGTISFRQYAGSPVDPRTTAVIEGTVRDRGLEIMENSPGVANVAISNLAFNQTAILALTLRNLPGANVTGSEFVNNQYKGASLTYDSHNAVFDGNNFARNGYKALEIRHDTQSNSQGVIARNNRVTETGVATATSGNTDKALDNQSPGGQTLNNYVAQSAYVGIYQSGAISKANGTYTGNGVVPLIKGNVIESSCLRYSDCGAIYTRHEPVNAGFFTDGLVVDGNTISISRGQPAGCGSLPSCTDGSGIYLDDLTSGATVKNNSVSDAVLGIYVHNTKTSTLQNNKIWLASGAAVSIAKDNVNAGVGNQVTGNSLNGVAAFSGDSPSLPTQTVGRMYQVDTLFGDLATLATFSANQLTMLNGTSREVAKLNGTTMSLRQWLLNTPSDSLVGSPPARFRPYLAQTEASLLANLNPNFDAGTANWSYWVPSGSGSSFSYDGTNRCAQLSTTSVNSQVQSGQFAVTAGALYQLGFTLRVNSPSLLVARPAIDPSALNATFNASTTLSALAGDSVLEYDGFTVPATSSSAASLRLQLSPAAGQTSAVGCYDNFTLSKVTSYTLAKPSNWGALVSPMPTASRTYSTCSSVSPDWPASCVVKDVQTGASVGFPLTMAAGASPRLLVVTNSPYAQ